MPRRKSHIRVVKSKKTGMPRRVNVSASITKKPRKRK
jgi:hypothetical protein